MPRPFVQGILQHSVGGELVLMVAGETTVSPGNVVIQRNMNHIWRNDAKSSVYWVAVVRADRAPGVSRDRPAPTHQYS